MSRDFPDWINPWAAAQGQRRFGGTVPITRMTRLAQLLVTDAGEAGFEARFSQDEDRRPVIELAVEAEVTLVCQASLEPFRTQLERRSTLAVVEAEGEVERLPPHYDPVQADHGRLALATLVEDELLLAMPQVPRKPGLDAVNYSAGPDIEDETPTGGRPNPFEGLRGKFGES